MLWLLFLLIICRFHLELILLRVGVILVKNPLIKIRALFKLEPKIGDRIIIKSMHFLNIGFQHRSNSRLIKDNIIFDIECLDPLYNMLFFQVLFPWRVYFLPLQEELVLRWLLLFAHSIYIISNMLPLGTNPKTLTRGVWVPWRLSDASLDMVIWFCRRG